MKYVSLLFMLLFTLGLWASGNKKVNISIFPTSAVVQSGPNADGQEFKVTVEGTDDKEVIYTVDVGTINDKGIYFPPDTGQLDTQATVHAWSVANPNKWATATVTIKGKR